MVLAMSGHRHAATSMPIAAAGPSHSRSVCPEISCGPWRRLYIHTVCDARAVQGRDERRAPAATGARRSVCSAQRRAARRGRARHRGPRVHAAAAGDCRRRQRQDAHAGRACGAPRACRRRPSAGTAAHLFAPCRTGDDAPRRRLAATLFASFSGAAGAAHAVGGHVPQRRRAPAARPCGADRLERLVHGDRPRRCRGSDGLGAPAPRLQHHAQALSAQGHLPGDLFARGQRPSAAARVAGRALSLVRRVG